MLRWGRGRGPAGATTSALSVATPRLRTFSPVAPPTPSAHVLAIDQNQIGALAQPRSSAIYPSPHDD